MSSIHSQRAKRWNTNPFVAEWLANAFEYCHKTAEGKQAFETWVIRKYGAAEGRLKIRSCHQPPRRKNCKPTDACDALFPSWNACGVELGVSEAAMQLYHEFSASSNAIRSPERTKPAPKRRRGETSTEWLARRHRAMLEGCKVPNIDWEACRAIAISEADRTRDTIEVWRTSPTIFFEAITRRGASIIPSTKILHLSDEYKRFCTMDDAFRSGIYVQGVAHMVWSDAALLLEDLARQGLTTTSAIERAYKKDTALLWRLVTCFAKSHNYLCEQWVRLSHIISWCDHFRPYFKRWRNQEGVARIEADMAYINKHGYNGSSLDQWIVRTMSDIEGLGVCFFDYLNTFLTEDPSQANKFSQEAFDAIGDIAIAHEFNSQVVDSPFGQRLCEYACSFDTLGYDRPHFLPQVCFMDISKTTNRSLDAWTSPWGDTAKILATCVTTWSDAVLSVSMGDRFPQIARDPLNVPHILDDMWKEVDLFLWEAARYLDNPGEPGRVAKAFGLIDPHDQNRPTVTEYLFRSLEPSRRYIEASATLAPAPCPYVDTIPIATPTESMSKSGHAYVNATCESRPKSKTKTKGTATSATSTNEVPGPDPKDEDGQGQSGSFLFALPTQFKLGRRFMKIFHRILENDPDKPDDDAQNKGQLRWGDFERAMRRVGFDVVQTAGSSVRFDPPAQTARPITIHRPHPDSLLSPHMIKWVGARLKRTYGWTTASFAQGTETGETISSKVTSP